MSVHVYLTEQDSSTCISGDRMLELQCKYTTMPTAGIRPLHKYCDPGHGYVAYRLVDLFINMLILVTNKTKAELFRGIPVVFVSVLFLPSNNER